MARQQAVVRSPRLERRREALRRRSARRWHAPACATRIRLFDSADQEYVFADWTDRGFRALDHNRDGRITADEWHFDREGYRRADHNRDGVISRAEFLNETAANDEDDDRDDRFPDLDDDQDGRISKAEWHGGARRFNALDDNRDGFLSRTEMLGNEPPAELFTSVDINRDRAISLDEWHWSRASFTERDSNRDGRLTQQEFAAASAVGTAGATTQSAAYRAGYERGHDRRPRRRAVRSGSIIGAWDLEGQSELDTADSGYQPGMGPQAEYQAGYREGFRRGVPRRLEPGEVATEPVGDTWPFVRYFAVLRQGLDVVHEVPDLGVGNAPLKRVHGELRANARVNGVENLAVRRPVVPFGVGQIRRLDILHGGRGRAVAFAFGAVTGAAILRKGRSARLD